MPANCHATRAHGSVERSIPLSLLWAMLLVVAVAVVVLPEGANANYRPGSHHDFLVGKHNHLALPLPRARAAPKLARDHHGRVHLRLRVRYRVANWVSHRGARHDRALITPTVSRRLITTGPDPANPIYRKPFVDRAGLKKKRVKRVYRFRVSKKASRFLVRHGAFSHKARRRESARRLVWVDIQQDRDFKKVDGRFDWREGTAIGASDSPRRMVIHAAKKAGEENPYGTLSITNNTAAGVYCQKESECPLVDSSTGLPGSVSGTMNSSTYSVPMAVAGDAVQCFDQGTNGSNPAGFANYDTSGAPQPYEPGTVSAANTDSGGVLLPNTTGTTVTEGLAADYSLAWAGNQQTADTTGWITGTAKLGLQAAKGALGGFVSPGAIITGILGIFEYFLENSCKESGNYFNVTAAETKGAAASATINAQTEEWNYYSGTGSTPPGLQLNPSALKLGGDHLWLNTDQAFTTGLADNICDCSNYTGNNAIELDWNDYNPCITSPAVECSLDPPNSPVVTNTASSGAATVNCGKANVKCPFPAAGFPPVSGPVPLYATVSGGSSGVLWKCNPVDSSDCQSLDTFSGSEMPSMILANDAVYVGVFNTSGVDEGYLEKCDPITVNDCTQLDSFGSQGNPTALAYGNGNIYVGINAEAGTDEGFLYSCDANNTNDCTQIDTAGNKNVINDLLYQGGDLYAAISNGVLWNCSPTVANDCATFDSTPNSLNSLAYGSGDLFSSLSNGVLWNCSPTQANSCAVLDTSGEPMGPLAYGNGSVYAGVPYIQKDNTGGYIWQCNPAQANSCSTLTAEASEVSALLYANNSVYFGTGDGAYIDKCTVSAPGSCVQLDYGSESSQTITALAAPPPPTK
jgi:hypothetical protein